MFNYIAIFQRLENQNWNPHTKRQLLYSVQYILLYIMVASRYEFIYNCPVSDIIL